MHTFNSTSAPEFVFQSAVPMNTPLWLPGGMSAPVAPRPHQHLVLPDFFTVPNRSVVICISLTRWDIFSFVYSASWFLSQWIAYSNFRHFSLRLFNFFFFLIALRQSQGSVLVLFLNRLVIWDPGSQGTELGPSPMSIWLQCPLYQSLSFSHSFILQLSTDDLLNRRWRRRRVVAEHRL